MDNNAVGGQSPACDHHQGKGDAHIDVTDSLVFFQLQFDVIHLRSGLGLEGGQLRDPGDVVRDLQVLADVHRGHPEVAPAEDLSPL